ncbi:MAG: response regulator [Fibrobacterota bacterium]
MAHPTSLRSHGLCPVTGLSVTRSPEWAFEGKGGKFYRAEFSLIGEGIVLARVEGYTTRANAECYLDLLDSICDEVLPVGEQFLLMEDYSRHQGTSGEARNYYVNRQKKNTRLAAVIYFSVSPFFAAVIRVSRMFVRVPFPIEIAQDYAAAVRLAMAFQEKALTVYSPATVPAETPALTVREVDSQVRLLIDLMSSINWEQSGIPISDDMLEKAGPFRPLYEALLILKQDYDEVAQKERETENKRREIEEQLHHAEKMQTIGTLAGGIAHDFNNMLGGITGFASLLKKRYGALEPGIERFSGMILDTGKRAASLIESLLIFARKGRQETVPIGVNDLLGNLVTLLSHTLDKSIQLGLSLDAGNPSVLGDRSQIQNLLLNLAVNAGDAMPHGGHLALAVRRRDLGAADMRVLVYPLPVGEYLEISVSDTGIGIPPEIRGRIFEPFFTTKETGKGTGLGLSSVYGTLQDHSAGIALESEPGRGTTFRLYFKALAETPGEDAQIATAVAACGSGRVLLVDDELLLRGVVQEMLVELGYTVTVADDGREALELFEKGPAAFDLVILDLIMPRMSGEECFRKMRSVDPRVKIIVSSGYSRHTHVETLLAQGAAGFLAKPYTLDTLSATLQKVCR